MKNKTTIQKIQSFGLKLFHRVEASYNAWLGEENNLFYYLGTISIFLMLVLLATGLILFLYYSPSVDGAYGSLAYLTNETFLGRYIRTIHRYASDALMFFVIIHMVRIFVEGKYKKHRRLAWVTGVIILFFLLLQGVTGYILPLDSTARFIMASTAEIVSSMQIFGSDIVRSFSNLNLTGNWIIWIILIVHLFIPLAFLILLFVHVKNVSRAKLLLPKKLLIGFSTFLIIAAILFPITMVEKANSNVLPFLQEIDYFYLFFSKFFISNVEWYIWVSLIAAFIVLIAVPWLEKPVEIETAKVDLDFCTGCQACAQDCPYQAITMMPRNDDSKVKLRPDIDTSYCSGCSVCVGSCDFGGMGLKNQTVTDIKQLISPKVQEQKDFWNLLVCKPQVDLLSKKKLDQLQNNSGIKFAVVPCSGMLGPEATRHMLSQGSSGVIIGSCPNGDCHYREGNRWLQERLKSVRKPRFKSLVSELPIYSLRFNSADVPMFEKEVAKIIRTKENIQEAEIRYVKQNNKTKHISLTTLIISALIFAIYLGSTAYSKTVPLNKSKSRVFLDFYYLSKPKFCDLNRLDPNKVKEVRERLSRSIKLNQLTPEAQKRFLKVAEQSVRDSLCSRARNSVELLITVDKKIIKKVIFNPRGSSSAGLVHVLKKIDFQPGEKELSLKLTELSSNKNHRVIIKNTFTFEAKGGSINYIYFDKENNKIIWGKNEK